MREHSDGYLGIFSQSEADLIWQKFLAARQWHIPGFPFSLARIILRELPNPKRWTSPPCERSAWLIIKNDGRLQEAVLKLAQFSCRQGDLPPVFPRNHPLRGVQEIVLRPHGQTVARYPFSHVLNLPPETRNQIMEERWKRFGQGAGSLSGPIELPLTSAQADSLLFHLS